MKSSTLTRTASQKVSLSPQGKFLTQRTKQLIGGLAVALSLSLLTNGKAEAASFSFTRIVDTTSPTNLANNSITTSFNDFYNSGDINYGFSRNPVINDSGLVAFFAGLNYQGLTNTPYPTYRVGIFTGDGETTIPIADPFIKTYDQSIAFVIPYVPYGTGGRFALLIGLSLNNKGTVAFFGGPSQPYKNWSLWKSDGQNLTWADSSANPCSTMPIVGLDINDAGTVAYGTIGSYCGTIYPVDPIVTSFNYIYTPSYYPYFRNLSAPSINNSGTVAFVGSFLNYSGQQIPAEGIFINQEGTTTQIVDNNDVFKDFNFQNVNDPSNSYYPFSLPNKPINGKLVINDNNTVAFFANQKAGDSGIFTYSNGSITTIVDTSSSFIDLGNFSLNNSGTVAFAARLQGGGYGIFTGVNPVTDKVIAVGDSLFGSTVTALGFSSQGLNNSGQVAFWATLANGTEGIFRADLTSQTPVTESVPEPISVLSLLAFGAWGAGCLCQRHRKRQA